MLRIYKGTGPGVIVLIALTLAALWLSSFIDPQMPFPAVYDATPMPLYGVLKSLIGNIPVAGVISVH